MVVGVLLCIGDIAADFGHPPRDTGNDSRSVLTGEQQHHVLHVANYSPTVKLNLVWKSISLFSIAFLTFFLCVFTDNPGKGDNKWYSSEIFCGSTSVDKRSKHLCTSATVIETSFFRGDPRQTTYFTDYQGTYTSALFADFLRTVIGAHDSLERALIKIYILKSGIAALSMLLLLLLLSKFPQYTILVTRCIILIFAMPFLLISTAGVYPPGLTVLALVPGALALRIVLDMRPRDRAEVFVCTATILFSIAVSASNRLEATYFTAVVLIFTIATLICRRRFRLLWVITPSVLLLATFVSINKVIPTSLTMVLGGRLKIVPDENPTKLGDFFERHDLPKGFSHLFMAPITMVDNSIRRVTNTIFQNEDPNVLWNGWRQLAFVTICVIPFLFILVSACSSFITSIFEVRKLGGLPHVGLGLQAVLVLIYFFLPVLISGVWFLQYVLPLLLLFVLFGNEKLGHSALVPLLFVLVTVSNLIGIFVLNSRYGDMHIGELVVSVQLLKFGSSLAISLLFYLLYKSLSLLQQASQMASSLSPETGFNQKK